MGNEKSKQIERSAMIFNIQKYNMYDGPGIRTIVFFKGCPLRCKWCSNPESVERGYQTFFKADLCNNCGACAKACPLGVHYMDENGKHQINRSIRCGGCRSCVASCPQKAIEVVGEMMSISEILDIVKEDEAFYDMSGGGVTLGGGECTYQSEACLNLLMACKEEGINTAIETCGYSKYEQLMKIAEYVDLFLFDIKHMDPERHNELTSMSNERILYNVSELLRAGYNVKIRMPMLKGINDSFEEIDQVINFLEPYKDQDNFKGIDLLPYHKLGVVKYKQLGKDYPISGDPSLSEADLERIEAQISAYHFPVTVVKH